MFGDPIEPICLGRYVLQSELGQGGMGTVFAAFDPELQRRVALKLVEAVVSTTSPARQEALLEEARALAQLSHPNVVTIHDVGVCDGRVFIAMEELSGEPFTDWIARRWASEGWKRGRCVDEIVERFIAAGEGLVAAHDAGIIHRDFKPANVMLTEDGRVKVVDFGLACLDGAPARRIAGTPAYMAPEQGGERHLDMRVDVWAFCVSLYEALSGERPAMGVPLTPSPRVPRRVCRALAPGLARDSAVRQHDLRVILRALRRPRRLGPVVAGLALSGLVGVSAGVMLDPQPHDCTSAGELRQEVWSEQMRTRIEDKLHAAGFSPHSVSSQLALARLDAYAGRWSEIRHGACVAASIEPVNESSNLATRLDCLDDLRLRLEGLIAAFDRSTPQAAIRLADALDALPPIGSCTDSTVPPRPARTLSRDDSRTLAEAMAAHRLGDPVRARTLAAELDGVTHSEVNLLRATLAIADGDDTTAEHSLMAALAEARTAGDDEVEFSAWSGLVMVDALRHPGTVSSFAALGETLVERANVSERGRLRLMLAIANAETASRPADAARRLEKAFEAGRQLDSPQGGDAALLAAIATSRAAVAYGQGRGDEVRRWAERALELTRLGHGREHPDVARPLINLAASAEQDGDLERANELLAEAHAVLAPFSGHLREELTAVEQNRGSVYWRQGRLDEAAEAFERALTFGETSHGPDHVWLAYPLTGLGVVALERGDLGAARDYLQRSVRLQARGLGDARELGRAKFALARAYEQTTRGSGVPLAREALASLMTAVNAGDDVERVSAWLAEHGDPTALALGEPG